MHWFNFILLAGALLLSMEVDGAPGSVLHTLENKPAAEGNSASHKGVRVDCLNAINAAREEVDLPGFKKGETQGSKLPVDDPVTGDTPEEGRLAAIARSAPPENESEQVGRDDEQTKKKKFLEAVCKVILKARRLPLLLNCAGSMKEGTEESPQESELKGTYMYASQDSSDEICAAAVENWRGAVTNFPSVPPTYTAQELFYQKHENVSVVGLFNPKPNATVDCAIITCQREASKESEVEEAEEEEPGMNNHGRETGGRCVPSSSNKRQE